MVSFGIFVLLYGFSKCKMPKIQVMKPRKGIPGASILYTDEKDVIKRDDIIYGKLLKAPGYGLQGKPDYIFRKNISGKLLVMELKSGSVSEEESEPHYGDLMQIAAYFLIVEEYFGKRPLKGYLVYNNVMFIIKNSWQIRREVKQNMHRMRKMIQTGKEVVEPSFIKCKHCRCRGTVCEYCDE